jgi:hypothetical protein
MYGQQMATVASLVCLGNFGQDCLVVVIFAGLA